MMKLAKSAQGMTLLEILLVLAIASSIIVVSIKSIQQFKLKQNLKLIQGQVDTLFQAASLYYQANCRGTYDTSGRFTPGILAPTAVADIATTPVALSQDMLLTDPNKAGVHYLTQALVNNPAVSAYTVQLNPVRMPRTTYTYMNSNMSATDANKTVVDARMANTINVGNAANIIIYQIQVSASLIDPTIVATQALALGATCTSTAGNGGTVEPCSTAVQATSNTYISWVRLPSFAMHENASSLWTTIQAHKLANQQYTNDQMYELSKLNTPQTLLNAQYYLCGG
jgi:prepilin-type N-terminal cleavage/methylation domain-containing protein